MRTFSLAKFDLGMVKTATLCICFLLSTALHLHSVTIWQPAHIYWKGHEHEYSRHVLEGSLLTLERMTFIRCCTEASRSLL